MPGHVHDKRDKSSPFNLTCYTMLYPQNVNRIVTVESVTLLRPVYTAVCLGGSVAEWLLCWTRAQKVFKSQSRCCRVTVLGKPFTPIVGKNDAKQRNW